MTRRVSDQTIIVVEFEMLEDDLLETGKTGSRVNWIVQKPCNYSIAVMARKAEEYHVSLLISNWRQMTKHGSKKQGK